MGMGRRDEERWSDKPS